MKTICADAVTQALVVGGHLSFITVDRPPPPAAMCACSAAFFRETVGGGLRPICSCDRTSPWIGQRVALYAKIASEGGGVVVGETGSNRPTAERNVSRNLHPSPGQIGAVGFDVLRSRIDWLDALPDEQYRAIESAVRFDAIVGSGTLAEVLPIYDTDKRGPIYPAIIVAPSGLFRLDRSSADPDYNLTDQYPLQSWTPGRWALRFTDVAPTSERCARCGSTFPIAQNCPLCATGPVLAPVLSGDDPTYREWRP